LDHADAIGSYLGDPATRTFAELLIGELLIRRVSG